MHFDIQFDREQDGRWIAEIPALPGVMVYGSSKDDAEVKVEALAFRVLADQMENEKRNTRHVDFAVVA